MRIRQFMGADFDPLSRILGDTWHAHHEGHSFWHGADELCDHLANSDCALVAEAEDGTVLGAILLTGPDAQDRDQTLRMHWLQQRTRLAAMAAALGVDARADVAYLNEENQLQADMAQQLGSDGVGEIVVFIVAKDARGKGVGGALLREGVRWLADKGARLVRLETDDGCDWQIYEHLGMDRVFEGAYQADPNVGLYVYQVPTDDLVQTLGA